MRFQQPDSTKPGAHQHEDGIWVGLNWSGQRATGYDVSSEDVARNISSRVER